MLQNGENDDFDDDFSMILGQFSKDEKMIKLREIIIFYRLNHRLNHRFWDVPFVFLKNASKWRK